MYELKTSGDIRNLLKKISEISVSVGSIPKKGENPEYSYVMEKDVVDSIRRKLAEKGITIIPCIVDSSERQVQQEEKATTVTKVIMSYTFFDIETNSSITTYYQGEGEDTLDKGIYKAITGCQKYALLKTFLISTGDDPENEKSELEKDDYNKIITQDNSNDYKKEDLKDKDDKPTTISSEKAKQIYAMGKNHKVIMENILKKYGYNTTFQITEANYTPFVNDLKKSIV